MWYLGGNHPNPFRQSTLISYSLPENQRGKIKIYDTNGKLLAFFDIDGSKRTVQVENLNWQAGIYFYCLELEGIPVEYNRMILIK